MTHGDLNDAIDRTKANGGAVVVLSLREAERLRDALPVSNDCAVIVVHPQPHRVSS